MFTHLVPAKGVEHYYPEEALLRDIKFLGYSKVTLKSDQEPSILALVNAVKNSLSGKGIQCQTENSPKGDAHGMSNGEAELAVSLTQGLARTLKDQVEQNTGQRIDPKSPVLGWLIEYAGVLYTLFSYDESLRDGLTPFRKLKGRDWTVALPPFGELVDYRVRTQHKLEPRWDEGIFLGVRMSTTEKIIGTPKGVVVVQSVRRKPEGSRWSSEALGAVQGTPWAPSPTRERAPRDALELPEPVVIEPERPEVEAAPVEVAEPRPHLKRVYLRQEDFDQYGFTAGCKACSYLRSGIDRQGVPHSEDCRARIVQRLQETERGQQRIDAAKKRESEAKERADTSKRARVQEALPGPSSGGGQKRRAEEAADDPRLESQAGPSRPEVVVQSAASAPADVPMGSADDAESQIINAVLSSRKGFISAAVASGKKEPVCEEVVPEVETPYWDDISGKPLDPSGVNAARQEEVQVIKEMGVWEVIPRPVGEKVISTRWVDINKGDEDRPKYRSRFVARELKPRGSHRGDVVNWDEFYASMPPLSALRILFTLAVTKRFPDIEGKMPSMPLKDVCLLFIDVKKAHFWSPARRRLLVELPSEAGIDNEKYVGLLRKSLYGTRDAPSNWEAAIKEVMQTLNFVQARSNSCLYFHEGYQIRCEVHGDDFTAVGPRTGLDWFANELKKHWTIDVRGILGPPGMPNVSHSIVILNRLVSWTEAGIELEADPRHVDLLLREIGCEGAKVTTPLIKERLEEIQDAEALDLDLAAKYRSVSMRLSYLAQDRPDLLVLAKELAKGLKNPTTAHWKMLKRGARYLRSFPRMIHLFPNQSHFSRLEVWVDADHAGEAEYYSLVSGACNALGEQAVLKDWGISVPISGYMDATTGLAIGSRHGLGKVKHIDTVYLWVQQVIRDGRITLTKKPTADMLADLFTKSLDFTRMKMLLERMQFVFKEGRHHLALKA